MKRSHWAWGYEDKLPSEAERRELAERVTSALGVALPTALPLPKLADARMPEPRVALPSSLAPFSTQAREDRAMHTYGKAYPDLLRAFRGDFSPAPDVVAYPRGEADVVAAVEACAREGLALVPFGGGTSVVGGVEASGADRRGGVVSLDLRNMGRVREIDEVSRTALIEAGAMGPALEDQLRPRGYTLRHFPQSFEFSTLGGWVATRAGGHFATLYTHIDDLVSSLRVVTPAGVAETRRLPASGAGPDPNRLFIGSEGALGVITEAWVRLQRRPRYREQATLLFSSYEAAVEATREIAQAGLFPSNCRLLDATEAMINAVALVEGGVLLLAFESADHAPSQRLDRAIEIGKKHGGECPQGPSRRDEGERPSNDKGEAWRSSFLRAPYLQSALLTMGVLADTFETACTWASFAELRQTVCSAVHSAIAQHGGKGVVSCRFTHVYPDGPAPYFTYLTVPPPGRELEVWAAIKKAASDALASSGATITHHHAVGRTHMPWYAREVPAPFAAALRGAKLALDPASIMNPGVLVDPAS